MRVYRVPIMLPRRPHAIFINAALIETSATTAVLVLRAHYTMDVFIGAVAALYVASVVGGMSPAVDRVLGKL